MFYEIMQMFPIIAFSSGTGTPDSDARQGNSG